VKATKKVAAVSPTTGAQITPKAMPRVTLRIDFDAERAIGPGKIKLLELIEIHGSISEAGPQMGLSYRRAW
jgi:molybdate transport system regulatory protein